MVLHKRIFSLLCLIIILFSTLCACQAKLPPAPPQSFSAKTEIQFGNNSFSAALSQSCPGALQLEFSEPPELKGMVLGLEGGMSSFRYMGMKQNRPAPSLPQGDFVRLVNQVLQQLRQPNKEAVRRVTGGWEVEGKAGALDYIARVNLDGTLASLRVPRSALMMEFS